MVTVNIFATFNSTEEYLKMSFSDFLGVGTKKVVFFFKYKAQLRSLILHDLFVHSNGIFKRVLNKFQ